MKIVRDELLNAVAHSSPKVKAAMEYSVVLATLLRTDTEFM